jgi:hypothetical protein
MGLQLLFQWFLGPQLVAYPTSINSSSVDDERRGQGRGREEQDRSLSSLLDDDSKRLFQARDRLKSSRTESDYDSDSSEAMEAKVSYGDERLKDRVV